MNLFISHTHEDKDDVARPLAELLKESGLTVWYDEYSLCLGDSLRGEIEKGLSECDFGVVILSPSFFQKEWTKRELDSLTAREVSERKKFIIPVWHGIDEKYLIRRSPNLVDKIAISTSKGIGEVAKAILNAVNSAKPKVQKVTQDDLSGTNDLVELMHASSLAKVEADEIEDLNHSVVLEKTDVINIQIISPLNNGEILLNPGEHIPVIRLVKRRVLGLKGYDPAENPLRVQVNIMTDKLYPQGITKVEQDGSWEVKVHYGGLHHRVDAILMDISGRHISTTAITVTLIQ